MNQFGIGSAWMKGLGFFSPHAAVQAAILIGMGIVVPAVLQFLFADGLTGTANPAALGQNALATMAYSGTVALIVALLAYVLQTGSYFASWRLGLGGEDGMGAVLFGLIAAVMIVALLAGLFFVMAMLLGAQFAAGGGGSGAGIILFLIAVIPLGVLFAALYTVVTATVCLSMIFVLLIAAAFGTMASTANPALSMGGGGLAVSIVLAVVLLVFWLTVRLSCTTSAMARHGSLNLFGAMAESWRLTAKAQWRIFGYLALLSTLLCILIFMFALVAGASMVGSMQAGGPPVPGTTAMIVSLLVSVPFAYLSVLVPAGIYLEIEGESPAEIFT